MEPFSKGQDILKFSAAARARRYFAIGSGILGALGLIMGFAVAAKAAETSGDQNTSIQTGNSSESPTSQAEASDSSQLSVKRRGKDSTKRSKKGNKVREKEAEGTEAADRFEAHTVIKSKYNLNGESLEVDPD